MTGDLDAEVSLRIVDREGYVLARLVVAQFDMELEPDQTQNRVLLPQASLGRLNDVNDDWQKRVTVKMLPLWEPSATPIELERDNVAMAWTVPDGLQPGPWWVLGYDGGWARFRPLLWAVEGEASVTGDLRQAICAPEREIRQEPLRALVKALAADAEHADWPCLFGFLRFIRAYPANSLDVFQQLVRFPEAMVMALLRCTDEEFDIVWSLSEQLPFSWHLVPVTSWRRAAKRHFGALRAGLAGYDPHESLLASVYGEFRQRLTSRQPFFRSVCDWIGERIFPDQPLEGLLDNSELVMTRRQEALGQKALVANLIQCEEQALQTRHDPDEWYPDGPYVLEQTKQPDFPEPYRYDHLASWYRPVRCAPFVAAQISLNSLNAQESTEALLFELRQLRDFDSDWFDNAFAFALCLGLARRPPDA